LLVARSAAGHLNARILRNTVATPIENPPSGTTYGIRVDAGNAPSVDDAVCLDTSGNTTSGNDDGAGTHAPGIGLRKQGTNSTINDFGIVGMAATSTPNVENFVNSQNPGSASEPFRCGRYCTYLGQQRLFRLLRACCSGDLPAGRRCLRYCGSLVCLDPRFKPGLDVWAFPELTRDGTRTDGLKTEDRESQSSCVKLGSLRVTAGEVGVTSGKST
jgi:hypothetical protein